MIISSASEAGYNINEYVVRCYVQRSFGASDRIRTPLLIFESVITIVLVAFFSISNLKKNVKLSSSLFSIFNQAKGIDCDMKKYFLFLFYIVLVSCTPKSGDSNEQIDSLNQEINDLNRENKLLNDELKHSVSKNDIMLTQIFEYIDESRADLIDTRFYALYDANQIEVGDRFGDLSVSDIIYYNDVNKSEGYNLAFDGQIEVLGTLGEPHEGENLVVNVLDDSRFLIPNYYPDSGIALSIVNFDDFPELSYNSSGENTTFYFVLENIQLDGEEGSDFIYTSKLISYRRFN